MVAQWARATRLYLLSHIKFDTHFIARNPTLDILKLCC